MNFQQLRIIREAARRQFNLTDVANALYTSQSGVSKHIRDLEEELGVELFVRRGKRLLGLTEPGKALLIVVERMLNDARQLQQLAENFAQQDVGRLVVATTHTQARYVLPQVVTVFKQRFPKVDLVLQQASPREIAQLLHDNEADLGVATEYLTQVPDLVCFDYYAWRHAIVVQDHHPLAKLEQPTLRDLAQYPIITYQEGFTGRANIDQAFEKNGLQANIVLSAMDADVIKSYVELGLGIGIVAPMAYHPKKDRGLIMLSADHLFAENRTVIAVRRGHYLRGFAHAWLELCNPTLQEAVVREALLPS